MFKELKMTGIRNDLKPRVLEQVGNLAHGGVSTYIFFAANEKHGNRRSLNRVWVMPDRTEQGQKPYIHVSVELRHLLEKKAELRRSSRKTILVQKYMRQTHVVCRC